MSKSHKILAITTIILTFLILTSFTYFSFFQKQPSPISIIQEDIKVTKVVPNQATPLQPGSKQTFSLEFHKAVKAGSIQVRLKRGDITTNQAEEDVNLTLIPTPDGKSLVIETIQPILPLNEYHLLLSNKSGKLVFEARYLSEKPLISPVQSNNLQLSQYLPYETTTYRLIYLQSENIYVFNFKFNPDSQSDLETQFQQAKQEAIKFIKSKDIKLEGLVIDWRYS